MLTGRFMIRAILPLILTLAFILPCKANLITLVPASGLDGPYHGNRAFAAMFGNSNNVIVNENIDFVNALPAAGSTSAVTVMMITV
jgi:hypothetical protein